MKKRRILQLVCLAAAVLMVLQTGAVFAQSFPFAGYATDSVRLRRGPSYTADILCLIKKGDAVWITGVQGNYYTVEYEGRNGYVVSSFLSEVNPMQPVVQAQFGSDYLQLVKGSEGVSVKALQQALSELGFYTLLIDSKFGGGTESAVMAFQKKNNLAENGIADPALQKLLFEGKPLNSKGKKTDVKTLPPIQGASIYPGDRGEAVIILQQKLASLGLYRGSLSGEYDLGTQEALKAFQRSNRLKADGIVGKNTHAKLATVDIVAASTQESDTSSPAFVPEPLGEAAYPYTTTSAASVNLRKRASTSSMRIITVPQGASVRVLEDTGKFLKVTYRNYTGYVVKDYINIPEQYLEGKALDVDQQARAQYETLTNGADGRKVRALQQALSELGFYQGNIDGKFGAGTTTALKAFQKQNDLRQTGIALPELQQLLYEKRVRNSKNRLVYVKTLPPIEGLEMAQGDYGDAVYELHQLLTQAGFYDKTLSYEYTKATSQAVRAFQKAHSIKQTGKMDSFTMLALRTSLGVKTAQTQSGGNQDSLSEDTYVEVTTSTSGLPVTRLQARLVALGYYHITPDGVFNSDDIAALRQFQRINNLSVTGIGDLVTQQALYSASAIRADAQMAETAAKPQTSSPLKIGSAGDQVKALQSRLITLLYLTGKADGIYGTQTAAAVTTFQRRNSLKADGIAGSETLRAVYDAKAIANTLPKSTPPKTTSPAPVSADVNLKVGSSGSQVLALQQRLIELKYLTGNADGLFGPRTALAVQAFQEKNSLKADGIAGKLTMAKLMSSNAISNVLTVQPPVIPTPPNIPNPAPSTFVAPKASEVRYANWYTEIRPIARMLRNVIIYDFISGEHYNFRIFSLGKHADGATLTKEDTQTMEKIYGKSNWTPRPVWVIFSDGRVYMASTHSHGHEVDYISDNGLIGHLCIHFPREMDEAAQTGPYAVSHQNAILAGWDLTKNLAR